MQLQFRDIQTKGEFIISIDEKNIGGKGIVSGRNNTTNTIVCNMQATQQVVIDNIPYAFPPNTILPLVANQHFVFEHPEMLIAWQFNREFYCIADHDSEVGCVGFLFYGIQHPLFVHLNELEIESILLIKKLFLEDFAMKDKMQGEMLRSLLKRLIIRITRIAKRQTENYQHFTDEKMDLVRMFNLLLEANFRQKHDVQFYADALNKSPKTLSNLFAIFNYPPPSKLIQNRIILEAKRYLQYTKLSAKEIAYELGFSTPAHFSRFFKQNTGNNISTFKAKEI